MAAVHVIVSDFGMSPSWLYIVYSYLRVFCEALLKCLEFNAAPP